jgi:hypothetical protein
MESQMQLEKEPPKSNRTLIIVVIVAIVLCCCFVVAAAVGFYTLTAGTNGAPQEQPVEEVVPPSDPVASVPPGGGLANDILKNDVWDVMKLGAASMGCQRPSGVGLDIEVLQDPESGGVWVEKWPVRCASGDVYEFEVEFLPDDTGVTFNIKPLP